MTVRPVFGVGLNRTATTTLDGALRLLGVETVHFPRDGRTRREVMDWLSSDRSSPLRLSRMAVTGGVTDLPAAACYQGLWRAHPDARYILTTRPISAWLESCERLWTSEVVPLLDRFPGHETATYARHLICEVYGAVGFDRQRFADVFERHRTEFLGWADRVSAPALVIDLTAGAGWGPLCDFLGVDPPVDVPFPRRNCGSSTVLARAVAAVARDQEKRQPG